MARFIIAIALLTVIAVPAFAQKKQPDNALAIEAQEKKKEAEAIEKQYKSTLKRTSGDEKPTRVDPWQNMRGGDASNTKR
jgi:hypothetical protein